MFQANQVQDTRPVFFDTWAKHKKGDTLTPLETALLDIMLAHPEYHQVLDNRNSANKTFFAELGEDNPFLHMGLHLAVREQVATNRPTGIQSVYQALIKQHAPLDAEHMLMQCLADSLWLAQKNHQMPDENAYLTSCKVLVKA